VPSRSHALLDALASVPGVESYSMFLRCVTVYSIIHISGSKQWAKLWNIMGSSKKTSRLVAMAKGKPKAKGKRQSGNYKRPLLMFVVV
jgi:hypothetical protein